ncbi:MAG: type IX secretion system protein PorQ [Chitinophagales bacterium]|nr:type IX secretion system protein PorQ [Chitinophagales bacterium]MCZ2392458.1 type IX secretion system protein PorQ [Chitinophagales bacterium]
MYYHRLFILLVLLTPLSIYAQIGGSSIYSFLDLPISARATGLGGAFYAAPKDDIALSMANPSLLGKELHQEISFNTGFYLAGTNFGSIVYGHHSNKLKTTFSSSAFYTTYGKFDGRDVQGNSTGDFKAGNFYLSGGASRVWKKFTYGVQVKMIFSAIEQYHSFGLGIDLAASYHNPNKNLVASLLLRNIGAELKSYTSGQDREPLPLDLSFGVSKRFEKLPIRLNFVAHHLQKWDLTRPKLTSSQQIIGGKSEQERGFIDKLFAHISGGVEVEAGKPVRLRVGYDHLRRMEMGGTDKKELVGMSAGAGVVIQQFRVDYSFAKYHSSGSLNQIGITILLDEWGNKTN